ncbi:hypothetical protein L914_19222, partial [Phytophthora nicotianae]
ALCNKLQHLTDSENVKVCCCALESRPFWSLFAVPDSIAFPRKRMFHRQPKRALGTQDEPAGRAVGPSQPLLHAETKKKWAHKSVEMRPSQSTCKGSDDCKDLMTAESKDEEDRRSYCLSGGAE